MPAYDRDSFKSSNGVTDSWENLYILKNSQKIPIFLKEFGRKK